MKLCTPAWVDVLKPCMQYIPLPFGITEVIIYFFCTASNEMTVHVVKQMFLKWILYILCFGTSKPCELQEWKTTTSVNLFLKGVENMNFLY